MTNTLYHPQWVREHYDTYGMQEWNRWERGPAMRVAYAVHVHYLWQAIQPGMRVLEIGAGAGRFTQVLAAIGARVTVVDISPGQLALNRQQAASQGFAAAVEQWVECDACDLTGNFTANLFDFDAVVAYGGLLSYVYDRAGQVLQEFRRVVKSHGVILPEVMCLWGSIRVALPQIVQIPPALNRPIVSTGDLDGSLATQHCHLYRAGEFRHLLEDAGLLIEVLSSTGVLSPSWDEALRQFPEDRDAWAHLIEMELDACRESGCLDMGSHLLAVCRKVA